MISWNCNLLRGSILISKVCSIVDPVLRFLIEGTAQIIKAFLVQEEYMCFKPILKRAGVEISHLPHTFWNHQGIKEVLRYEGGEK